MWQVASTCRCLLSLLQSPALSLPLVPLVTVEGNPEALSRPTIGLGAKGSNKVWVQEAIIFYATATWAAQARFYSKVACRRCVPTINYGELFTQQSASVPPKTLRCARERKLQPVLQPEHHIAASQRFAAAGSKKQPTASQHFAATSSKKRSFLTTRRLLST